ncbi:MAG: DUF1349 domain-containing protein [Actinobacteria bacterium]|nr:DUF1349 domain-containing protein [Actinomycetota bacterium]
MKPRRGSFLLAMVLLASLAVGTAPARPSTATGPAFESDDFNTSSLDARWSVVDPVGDGSVALVGAGSGQATLDLSVPGGVSHDAWGTNRSLRAVQATNDVDFEAEVAFASVPSLKYQMQGLMVEQDADDWLRFDVYHDGSGLRVFAAATTAGSSKAKLNQTISASQAVALRVHRAGDTWTLSYAADGGGFTTVGSFSHALGVSTLGPFAANHHTTASSVPAFTAQVDYVFDTAAPISPEDDPYAVASYTLSTSTVGSGSVSRSPDGSSYAEGTEVQLTAVADSGWRFDGWSGDLTGSANPQALVMDADKSVTATFSADTAPPVISAVAVSTTDTSATVTWTTDEPATSAVAHGPTTAYENGTVSDATLTTTHSITLDRLQPATTYHYQVASTDAASNTATTPDATFTTEATASTSGAFESDDFNTSSLDARWSVVDPVGDGSVALVGAGSGQATLDLSVPGGVSHDAWGTNRSLRAVQATNDVDFEAEVAFASVPSLKYQMQGLMVEQDADDWLRFDVYHDGSGLRVFAAATTAGSSKAKLNQTISASQAVALRVHRAGDTWTLSYAADGGGFTTVGSFSHALGVSTLGPFAANHHTTASSVPAFTAQVDYVFDTAAPISPEDDPYAVASYTLSTSTVGSGSVSRSPDGSSYAEGTEVQLTAVADSGWRFDGWSGDLTGSANPQALVMDADKSVTATFSADTAPPVISAVAVSTTDTSATVTWTTDEPATSAVAHGPTTAYENGTVSDATLTTTHSIILDRLQPATTYHYQVASTDAASNTATTPDATFTTDPDSNPVIDLWHGPERSFGSPGRSQLWINILGNVFDGDGIAALSFTLNGGASRALSMGPDNRRLSESGDFNVEIGYDELLPGANQVAISAADALGNTSTAVVNVHYESGLVASLPHSVDWTAGPLDQLAQIVDGRWTVADDGTIRTAQLGYDRLITLGDLSWRNYEVQVPVTVHGFGPGAYSYLSGAPLVGLALRWQGHSRRDTNDTSQPRYYWWPTGALGWYRWYETKPRAELLGNEDSPKASQGMHLDLGTAYILRAQVQDTPTGTAYRLKLWAANELEPASWTVAIEDDNSPATGSVGLIAHHVDVTFGHVVVTPLEATE